MGNATACKSAHGPVYIFSGKKERFIGPLNASDVDEIRVKVYTVCVSIRTVC